MPKSRTLPSRSRVRVLQTYRSRGNANRNLWLVYSYKTNRDWILGSDRHLVHWLIFLETNPDVRAFTIEPDDSEIPSDLGVPAKNIAASVEVRSGEAQYHVIKLSETPEQAGTADGNLVRVFSEADLFPLAGEAMRWLKLVNFCAAIRDEQQQETTLACIAVMRKLNGGTLGQILEALPGFDSQIAIGVVSRMVIQNSIAIDLSFSSFTLSSQWNWRDAE